MKKSILTLIFILISFTVSAQTLNDLNWVTEDYPPYNFTENGQTKGIAVDLLLEVWKKVGIQKTAKDISVYPWARGLSLMETNKDNCLFSTTLTPRRKKVLGYQFFSPIPLEDTESLNHIIAPKSMHVTISSPEDLNKYRIGVVLGDVGQDLIVEANVSEKNIDTCTSGEMLMKKMLKHRFDIASYGFTTLQDLMKDNNIDSSQFEVVYTFPPLNMGYAFNKDADPALIKELQKALDAVYADGTADAILKKYTSH